MFPSAHQFQGLLQILRRYMLAGRIVAPAAEIYLVCLFRDAAVGSNVLRLRLVLWSGMVRDVRVELLEKHTRLEPLAALAIKSQRGKQLEISRRGQVWINFETMMHIQKDGEVLSLAAHHQLERLLIDKKQAVKMQMIVLIRKLVARDVLSQHALEKRFEP